MWIHHPRLVLVSHWTTSSSADRVTICLENLETSGILTSVVDMAGILPGTSSHGGVSEKNTCLEKW